MQLQTESTLMMFDAEAALTGDYSGHLELLCRWNKWHCIRESIACI